ncbi:unnamed protein product [Larinioides sclopetarius]|uniref:Uncharacterized protein n=1 Tax=Larinioides sclopetarius TaxID=280406 RepID=A0AAV2BSL5_9ARAC
MKNLILVMYVMHNFLRNTN